MVFGTTEDRIKVINRTCENPRIVIAVGGNYSEKVSELEMLIKASGDRLTVMNRKTMALVRRAVIQEALGYDWNVYGKDDKDGNGPREREKMYKRFLMESSIGPGGLRPSVETAVHEKLAKYVLHTHPTALTILSCVQECLELMRQLLGPGHLSMKYIDPGILLGVEAAKLVDDYDGMPRGIMQRNHGMFFTSNEFREMLLHHNWAVDEVTKEIDRLIPKKGLDKNPFGEQKYSITGSVDYQAIMGSIYERVFDDAAECPASPPVRIEEDLEVLKMETEKGAVYLWTGGLAKAYAESGMAQENKGKLAWLSPDHLVYMRKTDDYIELHDPTNPGRIKQDIFEQVKRHGKHYSKVFVIKGVGIATTGDNALEAQYVMQFVNDALLVRRGANALGTLQIVTEENANFVVGWEVEEARKRKSLGG